MTTTWTHTKRPHVGDGERAGGALEIITAQKSSVPCSAFLLKSRKARLWFGNHPMGYPAAITKISKHPMCIFAGNLSYNLQVSFPSTSNWLQPKDLDICQRIWKTICDYPSFFTQSSPIGQAAGLMGVHTLDDVSLKTLAIKVGGAMLRSLEQTHIAGASWAFYPKVKMPSSYPTLKMTWYLVIPCNTWFLGRWRLRGNAHPNKRPYSD